MRCENTKQTFGETIGKNSILNKCTASRIFVCTKYERGPIKYTTSSNYADGSTEEFQPLPKNTQNTVQTNRT